MANAYMSDYEVTFKSELGPDVGTCEVTHLPTYDQDPEVLKSRETKALSFGLPYGYRPQGVTRHEGVSRHVTQGAAKILKTKLQEW